MIRLVLPYPISANRYWGSFAIKRKGAQRHSVVVAPTKEALAYKEHVGWICKAAGVRGPIRGKVKLHFRLVPANGICMDLDNCLKVAIDSLKNIAFLDDSQVWHITAERFGADGHARLEVDVEEYDPPAPPLFTGVVMPPVRERKPEPVPEGVDPF